MWNDVWVTAANFMIIAALEQRIVLVNVAKVLAHLVACLGRADHIGCSHDGASLPSIRDSHSVLIDCIAAGGVRT
jgi:hypothetical protein